MESSAFSVRSAKETAKSRTPKRVRLDLFDGQAVELSFSDVQPASDRKSMVWTGQVEGREFSHAVIVSSGSSVTGNITTGDGVVYQIRTRPDGVQVLNEVVTRDFPNELEPRTPPASVAAADAGPRSTDDGTTIDVLVVYTPAARAAAGGEEAMRQLIQLGIAETNQGYSNSGMPQRVRLAGTGEVAYDDSGDLGTDLDRLTETGDGHLDEIHRVRDLAGADLVSLWVEKGDGCGIGWLLSDVNRPVPHLAFNVVRRDCATGYFSFGHEMGHNMGAMHAHEDTGGEGVFPYSRGFKNAASAPFFRCIMSYNCGGAGCDRVNVWSSPELKYRGITAGTQMTDNRNTLLRTAQVVASYRESKQSGSAPAQTSKGYPESPHPYGDNMDRAWTYTLEGSPAAIYVTFDNNTYVEEDYDFLVVTDGQGREIEGSPFTGEELAGRTVRVPGDTVRIRLLTDDSITDYGFAVSNVTPANGGNVDLVAVSLSAPRAGLIGGMMDGVVSVVRNDGAAAAPPFRFVYYFVSPSGEVTFTAWGCNVAGLAPGASYTCGGGVKVPESLTAGSYVLVVAADDQEVTGDVDLKNNVRGVEVNLTK